jgi:hypothetical protein
MKFESKEKEEKEGEEENPTRGHFCPHFPLKGK